MSVLKAVQVTVGGGKSVRIPMNKRTGHKMKWFEDVLEGSLKYKVSFRSLTMAQREKRVDSVAKLLVAACVDRKVMKSADESTYFNGNENLAIDCVTLLDSLKLRIQYELNLNLNEYKDSYSPLNNAEAEERELTNNEHGTLEEREFSTALTMMGEHTQSGYNRVRKQILQEFTTINAKDIPSFYHMTKR